MATVSAHSSARRIWSLGHSNRPWDTFAAIIKTHEIGAIVDVRSYPASRRWPHFNREAMVAALDARDVAYHWLPVLGGRRRPIRKDSPHTGWTVEAFRHYADYMETDEFRAGLDALIAIAQEHRTAFLCAEALYLGCHRRLIADRLKSLGWQVLHIRDDRTVLEHAYPEFLRIDGERLVYDGGVQGELGFS